jgi:lysophospholipase L1-like esterase
MARRPDLAVIAYGTNEAFDGLRVSAYEEQLALLVGRIRRGAPDVDCLIVGPPDALEPSGASAPRVALIGAAYRRAAAELGCAFVSAQALMGGPGSYAEWMRAGPPLATGDRVHYTPKGYRRLGELLAGAALGLAPSFREANSP